MIFYTTISRRRKNRRINHVAESSGDDDPDEVDNDKLKKVQHGPLEVSHSLQISFYKAKCANKLETGDGHWSSIKTW